MKTLLPKFLCITLLVLLSANIARAACSASFTKSISGLTVTFTNTSTTTSGFPAMMMYNWNFGDATSSSLKNPVKTYSTPGVKIVQLFINDSFGCMQTYTDTFLLVSSTPTCTASFTKTISGLTVTFNNTSTTSGTVPSAVHYTWGFSDGSFSTLKNPVKTFATGGVKTVQLSVFDSSTHCYSSYTDTFVVVGPGGACGADFTKTVSANGLSLTFNNLSLNTDGTTNGLHYYWYFSDGTSSTLKNPTKTFATGGYKTIQLTITDTVQGCFSSKMDSIFLTPSSSSTCAAGFTKTVSGLTVSFNNTSTSSGSVPSSIYYYWYFSDGTSSTLKNPVITFATPGSKSVMLTIYDSSTSCNNTITDSIFISGSACAAHFTATVTGLNVGLVNHSLNTNGTSAGLSYYWYFSDGTSSTLKNPSKTFTSGGLKTVSLTISDSVQGCFSTKTDTFFISAPAACSASFIFPLIAPLTIRLTSTSTNGSGSAVGLRYIWTFSDGVTAGPFMVSSFVKTFATPGVKWARLDISDSLGCTSSRTDSFMLSASSCAASFTKVVSGLSVAFNNTSLNTNGSATGLSYYWYFSDGTSSTLKNPTKTFTTPGTKTIQLTITDSAQGCFSTHIDTILLTGSNCAASFTKTVSGLSVSFNNTSLSTNGSATGLQYLWDFGDGTTSTLKNPVKTYTTGGIKVVSLSISDSAQGCFASKYDTLFLVPPPPLCSARFSLAIDTTTPFRFFLLNTSLIRSTSTFFWSFGDGGTSTLMTPTHTYANFGRYFVCLTVADSLCTSTYCDTIGMDSTGKLLKAGAFGFVTIDQTTLAPTTGIGEVKETPEYTIYPNPTSSDVYVDFALKTAAPVSIEVSDLTGKIVHTQTVTIPSGQHSERIDLGTCKPSIYFLNITSPDGRKNYKLIKN